MVQLRRSEAGFKLAEGEDDGFDLCLAQASLVLIRLEERMRAAARHLSPCRMKGAQCSLWRSVDRPNQHDYAVFGDSETNRPLSLKAVSRAAAALSKVRYFTGAPIWRQQRASR